MIKPLVFKKGDELPAFDRKVQNVIARRLSKHKENPIS
jgi:hypothetical protein